MQLACAIVATAFALLQTAEAKAAELVNIQTPSGNIHCQFNDELSGDVDCEIIEGNVSEDLPQRPPDCDLGWGQRFIMNATGPAQLACYGDTVRKADGTIIPYGGTFSLYGIACVSERTGLICTNEDGHGFSLSKARQELF